MPFPFPKKGDDEPPKKPGKSILGGDSEPEDMSEEEIHGRALAKALERKDYKGICAAVKDIMAGYDSEPDDDDMMME